MKKYLLLVSALILFLTITGILVTRRQEEKNPMLSTHGERMAYAPQMAKMLEEYGVMSDSDYKRTCDLEMNAVSNKGITDQELDWLVDKVHDHSLTTSAKMTDEERKQAVSTRRVLTLQVMMQLAHSKNSLSSQRVKLFDVANSMVGDSTMDSKTIVMAMKCYIVLGISRRKPPYYR